MVPGEVLDVILSFAMESPWVLGESLRRAGMVVVRVDILDLTITEVRNETPALGSIKTIAPPSPTFS